MSTAPLQEYFDCLNTFASATQKKVDESSGMNLEKVKNLIEQGCLSGIDSTTFDGLAFLNVSITPHGAVVLAEWSALLVANSPQGRILDTVGKILWLLAGMFITVGGSLLLKAVE